MAETPIKNAMTEKLTRSLEPIRLEIEDQSHAHANHAAMKGLNSQESHFKVTLVSKKFEGLKPIQRHRLMHETLGPEIIGKIHALSMSLSTEEEAKKGKF